MSSQQEVATPIVQSPLRYPGGKSKIAPMILAAMEEHGLTEIVEPFAGGGGVSLYVASRGCKASMNDACPSVAAFWREVENNALRLAEDYLNEPVTVENWRKHSEISSVAPNGLSTLFLNRTTVNGVLFGAGPIGGYEQTGKYKIDARAYKQTIHRRLLEVGKLFCDGLLQFSSRDGVDVVRSASQDQMLYVDPPYIAAGPRLYSCQFDRHEELRDALAATQSLFILSYDDHDTVRDLYAGSAFKVSEIPIEYASCGRSSKIELIITKSEAK